MDFTYSAFREAYYSGKEEENFNKVCEFFNKTSEELKAAVDAADNGDYSKLKEFGLDFYNFNGSFSKI